MNSVDPASPLTKTSRISPLARRVVTATVAFSTAVALLTTAVQLYVDYRRDLDGIEQTFDQVQLTYLPTITNALWATSRHEMQIALNGLVQLPDMRYVEVTEGEVIWGSAGTDKRNAIKARNYPLSQLHRGRIEMIGNLRVVIDMDGVYQRLVNKFWIILISNSIKTFFVAGFMLWLFRWLVTRHLRRIADFAARLGISNLDERLSLTRPARPNSPPDEFDWVLAGFNQMQTNLAATVTALQQQITEREKVRRALSALASGAATKPEAFYAMAVRELAQAYNARGALIGLISGGELTRMRTLALWADQPAGNTEINLEDTPFAGVLTARHELIFELAEPLFPRGSPVSQLNIRGCYCAPLINHEGINVGVVAVFDAKPLPSDVRENPLLGVYAQRIAAELERSQALDTLHQTLSELEQRVEQRTQQVVEQARIIDEIHDSVITTDLQDNITSWNYGAERLFGYNAGEILGRPISVLYPPDYASALREKIIAPLAAHHQHEIETRMRHKNGALFYVHSSLSVLHDTRGKPRGAVVYTMDITARKHAEALAEHRTSELEAANRELEAFSYSVSHDLRAPLRSIDGFSQALLEDYGEHLDQHGHSHLQRVRKSAQRMGVLIDDMLRLARVTRAGMHHTRVDLTALTGEIIANMHKHNNGKHAEISVQPGLTAFGDAALLRVVLENLLDNAYKYSSKAAQPRIEVGAQQQDGRTVYFVLDNGVGFDMTYANKLFNAFQRLHRNEEFPGTGIGLATVKRIIHRHGGKVWAKSSPGAGAVFYFTLAETGLLAAESRSRAAS